jgi:hypothetical protein
VLDDRFYYALAAAAPDVLVVDSYTSLMLNTGLDPNKIEFGRLAGMLGALNTLVICVAHANKAPLAGERPTLQQVAGSFALAAMAQTGIVCWHPNHDAQPNLVSVACMRGPRGGFKGFDIDFQDVDNDGLALRMINATQREARADVAANAEIERAMNGVLAWLTAHPAPWPRKMIREAVIVHGASDTGLLPEAHIAGAMARLTSAGLVTMHPGVGAKPPTYEIRSVQNAPGAVALSHAGDVVTAPPAGPAGPGSVGVFRRS